METKTKVSIPNVLGMEADFTLKDSRSTATALISELAAGADRQLSLPSKAGNVLSNGKEETGRCPKSTSMCFPIRMTLSDLLCSQCGPDHRR